MRIPLSRKFIRSYSAEAVPFTRTGKLLCRIEKIKEASGIVELSSLEREDVLKILSQAGERKITETQLKTIVEIFPDFSKMAIESLKSLSEVVSGAKGTQAAALSNISESVKGMSEALAHLAKNAESDAARTDISRALVNAGSVYIQFAQISKEMSADNNISRRNIAAKSIALCTITMAGVGAFLFAKHKV
ncbi:hypothetical protein [Indioceanicola profundi]|uniref:hypothetical protein n=1 Tax=Indioceanicola profundi TaxID=2220096 RepID=UPI0013C46C0A|nr:hypothetical protein [Indioceanicola profundi]